MMTEKRFEYKKFEIIEEYYISYSGGDAYLISDGLYSFYIWENKEDTEKLCTLLNSLREDYMLEEETCAMLLKERQAIQKDYERQNNEIKLLREQLSKIPKGIREVWLR